MKGISTMSKHKPTASAHTQTPWQLHLGRNGLRVNAGRHATLSLSLPVLAWGASFGGLIGTVGHWIQFLP